MTVTADQLFNMTPAQRLGAVQVAIQAKDWATVDVITFRMKVELEGADSQQQYGALATHPVSAREAHESAPLKLSPSMDWFFKKLGRVEKRWNQTGK